MILLVGNWKMAPNKSSEALNLAKKILLVSKTYKKSIQTVICAPSIHIPLLAKNIKNTIFIGAQSVSGYEDIAQTGLLNANMIKDYGAMYCIVGHSEVRARGESDESIVLAVNSLLNKKVTPIICVGEKDRDAHGWYLSTVKDQVEKIINSIPKASLKKIVLAYEPVWAIGKEAKREATPVECREMIIFIRKTIADLVDAKSAQAIPILYGGSVNDQNAVNFIKEGESQGLLVGRASLDIKKFSAIMKNIVSI